jgi:amylosucrase
VQRLVLAHLMVLGFGGLPVLWMGDELALRNDPGWADEPSHADDNRWAHRPRMPWDVAQRRHVEGTVEHRVWSALTSAVRVRARLPALHAAVPTTLLDPVNPAVVAWVRRAPAQTLVALHNVTASPQVWPRDAVPLPDPLVDALSGSTAGLVLPPYGCLWLVDPA